MTDRETVLVTVDAIIASAVQMLYPLCGEQVTIGILQQMAEEQATLASLGRLIMELPPTSAKH